MVAIAGHVRQYCADYGLPVASPASWPTLEPRDLRYRKAGSDVSILGTRVVRTEDPRLLTVGGTYVDDLSVPELVQAARVTFVRSPIAHARITGIDAAAAL